MEKNPFQNEVESLCRNIYRKLQNAPFNKCQNALLNSEFYWERYSLYLKEIINKIFCFPKIIRSLK